MRPESRAIDVFTNTTVTDERSSKSEPCFTAAAYTGKRRVFLVDDHPLVCEWLTTFINGQTDLAVCGMASNAVHALSGVLASGPDVVIVDLSLEGSSGLELIKDLRARSPRSAILVLSMHEENLYAERVLCAGARGYVTKRASAKNILYALRRVLSGEIYLSENFAGIMAARCVGRTKRADPTRSPVERLSGREQEVFRSLGEGIGTRQISENLGLSLKTVQAYCARIKDKLSLNNATELLMTAMRVEKKTTADS